MRRMVRVALVVSLGVFLWQLAAVTQTGITSANFVNFEGAQTNPIRLSADGTRLFAVNTPDARLSIFDVAVDSANPKLIGEIPVGIEPVSVNPRTNDEVWVVNQVSDSISVVSVPAGVVIDTIHVKDEPADVVFAGTDASLAFVSVSRSNEVRVFDAASRKELARIPLEGENPRALALSPDGTHVYVAFALSGNKSTIVPESVAPPQPSPTNSSLPDPPQVGLIVHAEDPAWAPSVIGYKMPDNDVAEISVASLAVSRYFSGVGTINFGIAVDPKGNVYVTNTEARNLTRFEPGVRGHIVDNRITRVDVLTGAPVATDLNPQIDYSILPNDAAKSVALAQPTAVVPDATNGTFLVAAFGTDRIARVSPDGVVLSRIDLAPATAAAASSRTMRGPRGLALKGSTRHLYVMNRIANTISIVDATADAVLSEIPVGSFDPTPATIRSGRGFLYDAKLSGNGTAACAACHIDADMDLLAWDLGNPGGVMQQAGGQQMHPMKGPMTTQTLRGLNGMEPLHWRGDKVDFVAFNPAFASLMGGTQLADLDMVAYSDYVKTLRFAPNPNRNLDNTLPATLAGGDPRAGRNTFLNEPFASTITCNSCHTESSGGTNRQIFSASILQEPQAMKVPHLRNLYQKTGFNKTAGARSVGGFGFLHDGSLGTLFEFLSNPIFQNLSNDTVRKRNLEAFLLAFDTGMAPAVGHTRTVTNSNMTSAEVTNGWVVLEQQAALSRVDVIVKGTIDGQPRGLLYRPSSNDYVTDRPGLGPFTRAQLAEKVAAGDTLTVMGVPPGSGMRMGIDRDVNGVLDGDTGEVPPPPPSPPPPPPAPPVVIHVADIVTTDANGMVRTSFKRRDTIFWRVQILDQNGKPGTGVSVQTNVAFSGIGVATLTATTGSDGWARFNREAMNDIPGTYTVTVSGVSKTDAIYDPAADVRTSTTYTLRKTGP
jgi:YVTN family beta-propeller protein